MKIVKIPVHIGDTKCNIECEVVNIDLPLLLSKEALKRAGTVLNLAKDEATMFQKPVKLEYTSTGHYCIDLGNISKEHISVEEVLILREPMDVGQKRKVMIKSHRQFGHASAERLKKLLINAGIKEKILLNILEEVVNECEICSKFKRSPPRPAVRLPLATELNETVAADLHVLENSVWLLHIIDHFTRYSAGAIIRSKTGSVFVDKFLKHWISIFGAPKKFFSDNGGEFDNEEVKQMGENFGIEILTTAAYSPWSNGTCERHNLTLAETIGKVRRDKNCSWEMALHWALMAKNSMSNVHGYSAHQLVFGLNPNLPSVLTDRIPALEGSTSSRVLGDHIQALHAAKKAFTQAECSERIRRALRKQTRTSMNTVYRLGDRVFYKRPDKDEWKGPGRVVGQDGVIVFVRHGGQLVRVHVCRLQLVNEPLLKKTDDEVTTNARGDVYTQENDKVKQNVEDAESDMETDEEIEIHTDDKETPVDVQNEDQDEETTRNYTRLNKLRKGQSISFRLDNETEKRDAIVMGRAGKATGKYKHYYNVEYRAPEVDEPERQCIDLSLVKYFSTGMNENEIDGHIEDDVLITDEVSFDEAKQKEMQSWINNGVYGVVEDTGQNAISTRWICSMKESDGAVIPKARLVARGFEELESDIPKDSPTCASESLKLVLAILAQNEWEPKCMDIKTAFLQGYKIDRKVFLRPPREAKMTGKLWKLNKCVYGLNDASLSWYKRVKSVMTGSGAKMSKVDPAVFFWYDEYEEVLGVLACHVDDFLLGGSPKFNTEVMEQIRTEFMKTPCYGVKRRLEIDSRIVEFSIPVSTKYIGIQIVQENNEIHLDQNRYAENLNVINISKARALKKDDMVTEKERTELRSKIGQILWIARQTRPDVFFDASYLASRVNQAKVKELLEANKVIKRVKTDIESGEKYFRC
ncbi:uncharacterized protein LOC135484764 [Lineus longissimus]|uniref:uncharacterized protein LOC135484764 n=1 Tax=Lineus longissimus TaxID=88925 RepID=UPI00315DDDC3